MGTKALSEPMQALIYLLIMSRIVKGFHLDQFLISNIFCLLYH